MIDICKCDVEDKEKLTLFRNLMLKWKKWLNGESGYDIFSQIQDITWYDTVFRTFNKVRKLNYENPSDKIGFNGPIIELLDLGFFNTQTLAIRKLTDSNYKSPEKSVYSLVGLIDDIYSNIDIFTRENFICYEGVPYNGPSLKMTNKWEYYWETKQENFDRFSGITENNRKRKDKIKESVLEKLKENLKLCKNIRTYVNKIVAHASTQESRKGLTDKQLTITLGKLDNCYQAIISTASFISTTILCECNLGGVPTPQFDQFSNLNKPMVLDKDLETLEAFWSERTSEIEEWESLEL